MKVKKGVLIQKLGNVYVAYDNQKSMMHELNEVGYTILSQIEKGKAKEQILEKIISDFKVRKSEALKDLETFLQVLKKADLIVGK